MHCTVYNVQCTLYSVHATYINMHTTILLIKCIINSFDFVVLFKYIYL